MRKTTNYGLTLYDKEDKMNITSSENSLNANMEIIDSTLKAKATINDMTTYIEEHKEELKGTDGKDGINGVDGKDGYSPTAIVTQTETGATITITDKSGTTTTTITNGKDGAKGDKGDTGANGKDGSDYVLTDTDKTEIANKTKELIPLSEYVKSVNNTLPDDKGNVNVTVTAQQPDFVVKDTVEEALEWLNENGDTSKVYVLPDGYIYAYMETVIKGETVPNFTNLMDNENAYIKEGYRYSQSSGVFKECTTDSAIVVPIPSTSGAFTLRVRGASKDGSAYSTSAYFGVNNQKFDGTNDATNVSYTTESNGDLKFEQKVYAGGYNYFVFHVAKNVDPANLIVTLNEEITYKTTEDTTTYKWTNTGNAFVSTDYGDKIAEIETTLTEHDDRIENLELNQVNGFSLEHSSCSIFRKVVCCGDSFTAGYIGTTNDNIIQTNYGFAWPSYLARLTGNEYVNCGHSGKDVLTWQTSAKGLPRAQAVGKAQAYIIGLGLNDASLVELGTPDDIGTDNQTYYGGMSKIIRELNAISPTAKIFVQTIPSDYVVYMNYSQAVRDVVNAYKDTYPVHLLDLYEYKALYKTSKLTKDAIMGHYSPIGYQQFAENLRYVWSDYINKNISKFQDVYLIPYDKTPDDIDN